MISILIALSSICISANVVITDKIAFFDNLYLTIQNISFEYEGQLSGAVPEGQRGNGPVWFDNEQFSGRLLYRSNGAIRLESIHLTKSNPTENQTTKSIKKLLMMNGKSLKYHENINTASAEQDLSHTHDTWYLGSPMHIFTVPFLKELARYEKTTLIYEGKRDVGGRSCEVYTFLLGKGYETGKLTQTSNFDRFYFDMERGGHSILFEQSQAGQILVRISDIQLQQFRTNSGKQFWLPISGQYESFMPKSAQSTEYKVGSVVNKLTLQIKPGTVRLNEGLDDAIFEIRDFQGALIKSDYKPKQVKPSVTVKGETTNEFELKSMLKERLKNMEEKGASVQARSVARGGEANESFMISFFLGILGLTGLGTAIYLLYNRRS